MQVTDEMRSMIASALVNTHAVDRKTKNTVSLCCAKDRYQACLAIVGRRNKRAAAELMSFFYESLSCCYRSFLFDVEDEENVLREQYYLDKVAALETL